jgi:sphingolipid delta-4 desaturase
MPCFNFYFNFYIWQSGLIYGNSEEKKMTKEELNFLFSEESEPHRQRTKEILKNHPEVRKLIGTNPYTFLVILGIVLMQVFIAAWSATQAWWVILFLAYFVGAFANHALYVFNHECTHNLVFKKRIPNLLTGILSDLPTLMPGSVAFRQYHLKHHSFQGIYELDADIPSRWEAKLIGITPWGKMTWLLFFPFFQLTRPGRIKEIKLTSNWTWINLAIVVVFDLLILFLFGPLALLYLFLSFMFSIGLHPVGARWIQEHYIVSPPQETYSYYGPLNTVAFNVGYHNEHHDISSIPWNRLPKLKKLAPELYDNLYFHKSWTKLLFKFIFDPKLHLFSRVTRKNRGGVAVTENLRTATK